MLLYLDKVEIEEVSNMKLDQLIDMDDLSLSSEKKNFIANVDEISVSTFGTKSFYSNKVSFNLDFEKEKEEMPLLYLDDNSTSNRENNCTAQTTKRAKDETQEVIM